MWGGTPAPSAAAPLAPLAALVDRYERLSPAKPFHILKKHFKAFVGGWDGAAELRGRLMDAAGYEELRAELRTAKELVG